MNYKIFESSDTNVKKFVFEWIYEKAIAEAVLYKYESYEKRTVICCSVQSGCAVGCSFCGTGKFFLRDLTYKEIVEQVTTIMNTINCDSTQIEKFQIMFMSMGEPFLNYDNLERAIRILAKIYPNAQLLISTSAPHSIYRKISEFILLTREIPQIGLQFSVHESTDEARKKIIPTNTCSLRQIASIGELWSAFTKKKPFFNYCVHSNNNSQRDAMNLSKLFFPDVWECTLSVICEKDETVHSSIERQLELVNDFNKKMMRVGFSTRVFNPAGQDDIGGGCGQLWYFQEWLKK